MTALQLFDAGRLLEAIQTQKAIVREQPTDATSRLLLAELHLFNGELDAVRRQLKKTPRNLQGMEEYLSAYQLLVDAEARRQRLFIDEDPLFIVCPSEALLHRLNALEPLRRGQIDDAVDALDFADAHTPWVTGHIDGREFNGARDGDDSLGPVLEIFVGDRYVWFPFEEIRRLRMKSVKCLRDRLFIPAHLNSIGGEEWDVYLPALYPLSHEHPDEMLRTGQGTDWRSETRGPMFGIGLHEITFGEDRLTLFDFTQWERRV
jgi:type VI secretion system protein ImpE